MLYEATFKNNFKTARVDETSHQSDQLGLYNGPVGLVSHSFWVVHERMCDSPRSDDHAINTDYQGRI